MLRQSCVTQLTTINDIGTACAICVEPAAVDLRGRHKAGAELRGDRDTAKVRAGIADLLPRPSNYKKSPVGEAQAAAPPPQGHQDSSAPRGRRRTGFC
jgi:hypothetical protein